MTPDELRAALERLGLAQGEFARLIASDARNVRRWLAAEKPIPGVVAVFVLVLEESVDALRIAERRKQV